MTGLIPYDFREMNPNAANVCMCMHFYFGSEQMQIFLSFISLFRLDRKMVEKLRPKIVEVAEVKRKLHLNV